MTSKRISGQINTIREATEKASATPEAALEFLTRAGIISNTKTKSHIGGDSKGHK